MITNMYEKLNGLFSTDYFLYLYTVKPVLRGHFWNKKKWSCKTGDLQRSSIHMKLFSMTGQHNGDLLILVTV